MRVSRYPLIPGGGVDPLVFSAAACTFTENMRKCDTDLHFDVGWMAQGNLEDQTEVGDIVSVSRGSLIATGWYGIATVNQGTLVMWINPEWDGDDDFTHQLYSWGACIELVKNGQNNFRFTVINSTGWSLIDVDASSVTAGTWYCLIASWDAYNDRDGTNHLRLTLEDAHDFDVSTITVYGGAPGASGYLGCYQTQTRSANAQMIGPFLSRRVLYDGENGIDLHNGLDELAAIWNSGDGEDPCTVTKGPFDWLFGVPMNQTAEALVTGDEEAWGMPHTSNMFTDGFCQTTYGSSGWTTKGTPSSGPSDLAAASAIFGGRGYTWTADADGEGIEESFTGLSAGIQKAIRGIVVTDTSDAVRIKAYDDTNSADIKSFLSDVADRVANGDFASDTLWTKGDGWSISGGNASSDGSQTASSYLTQISGNQANGGVVSYCTYSVDITVSGYSAGNVRILVGSGGASVGTWRSANGTYTETLTTSSGQNINVEADADFIGNIDDISVTPIPTRTHPAEMLFAFELPTVARNGVAADCTAITISVEATAAGQTVEFHQIEGYDNLLDNPSAETFQGTNPDVPDGWTNINFDAGDSQASSAGDNIEHSGSDSIEVATGADNEGIEVKEISSAVGDYYGIFGWGHTNGGDLYLSVILDADAKRQTGASVNSTNGIQLTNADYWNLAGAVIRVADTDFALKLHADTGATGTRTADDLGCILLDPVTLTVTPRDEDDSAEDGGICVDGGDLLYRIIPASKITRTQGSIRFPIKFRHDIDDCASGFGIASPYIVEIKYSNERLLLYVVTGGNARIYYSIDGNTGYNDEDMTGIIVRDTLYQFQFDYGPWGAKLYLDGVLRNTLSTDEIVFTEKPTIIYYGCNNTAGDRTLDAIFGATS